jgi:hypothetical protein
VADFETETFNKNRIMLENENLNEPQKPQLNISAKSYSRVLLFPHLPKWMRNSIKVSGLIGEEIAMTEKKLGKEKTQELVVQFKNEAYAQTGVNSDYIINKLRSARHGL